jgi:hypothetical protein
MSFFRLSMVPGILAVATLVGIAVHWHSLPSAADMQHVQAEISKQISPSATVWR